MQRVQVLCQKAFREGYEKGFQRGFEQGVAVGMGQAPQVSIHQH